MTSKREPAPQPDPRLDRYRKAASMLYDGDVLAGHLLTRVNVWWTTQGPWWRRRDVDPQERVEWFLDFQTGFDLARPTELDPDEQAMVRQLIEAVLLKHQAKRWAS